jgi:hypothetical protein
VWKGRMGEDMRGVQVRGDGGREKGEEKEA